MGYKPDGYTSVSPYLVVRDAQATIDFVVAAFGAQELRRFPNETGGVMHAEVRIGDSVVMLGEMPQPTSATVHVYVPDVDAAFAQAIAAGGTVLQPVMEKGDGDRRGGVADANGVGWYMASVVEGTDAA